MSSTTGQFSCDRGLSRPVFGLPMHTARMTVRRRTSLLSGFVVLLAVVVAGCGGSSVSLPELTSFTQVEQTSAAADTARFSFALETTMPGTDKKLSFGADGGFDTPARRAELNIDLSSLADLFESLGSGLGGMTQGDLGNPADWRLEAIQDGDTAYIHFPLLAKRLPAGKTWIKGNSKDLSGAGTGQLGQMGSLAGTDPRAVFGFLKAVSGSITAVGNETVRGVETSHYRATLDSAKLRQLVPADARQSLGSIDQAATQAGVTELPFDVWIDAEQRIRKLSVDLDAKQPGSSTPVQASLVVEFYDYGKPLDLQLPPADQVVDAATLKQTQ
jgi:hypothetical protein